ncbi:class I SAM-dependent methyltransferase [Planococcus lenghuensis]|uniref:SAM-dependent methyltransferase n=1 Tax=Planococcus lenghuensis TaxID=2213202 RepID=A0A1Q2KWN3_9BACL|nr:class I SAM-dependent methyltransferase [Planococcus lenghuensis]AQQ52217.1 SAM-dependent methyltransferase [Planococcus lenghuensis]
MKDDLLFQSYIEDAKQPFTGWDFSFVSDTGRLQTELLPWSYGSLVLPHVRASSAMLDMGTGGGEFLSKLQPFPQTVHATEGYAPNVPIARKRLEPLGVTVSEVQDDEQLPFEDDQFDLILNRHEAYSPSEIRRILKDGGTFITQQVGGDDCHQINDALGVPVNEEFTHWKWEQAVQDFQDIDMEVSFSQEAFPVQRFYDIGALVYYLKAIPWQVPGFEIDRYLDELYSIHQRIQEHGYFDVQQHRFILIATL